ncbi:MAG: YhfC family intramembrane metalloprotease [Clostridia bacterium]|nr:YhfC family intramembrane metalloprotease [Clostridia bacterium]
MSVPTLSMVFMALAALFCFAMPVLLLIYYRKKGADILPFFIGCLVFVMFALILEPLMHQLVLKVLPVGKTIMGNTLLYALYGGLAAGIFEETGRFLAFKTVLKKQLGNDRNALMYGAGHGGIEAILTVGFTYIGNIVISVLINAGQTDMLMATATGETAEQLQAVLDSLITTAPWTYLLAIVERALAVTTHICLSVLVFFAVKKPGKGWLFPLAILLHAAFDGILVILAAHLPAAAVEGCLVVMTLGLVFLVRSMWKKNAAA